MTPLQSQDTTVERTPVLTRGYPSHDWACPQRVLQGRGMNIHREDGSLVGPKELAGRGPSSASMFEGRRRQPAKAGEKAGWQAVCSSWACSCWLQVSQPTLCGQAQVPHKGPLKSPHSIMAQPFVLPPPSDKSFKWPFLLHLSPVLSLLPSFPASSKFLQ